MALLRSSRAEADLDREVAAHLALLEDDFVRRGMTADEARDAARRTLGGVDQTKERQRDERSFGWLEDLRRDLRYAARQLWRDRGVAAVGILSLALGIAAATAMFSAVDGVLLNPLPYRDVDRMVVMRWTDKTGRLNPMPMTPERFAEMLAAAAVEDGTLWEGSASASRRGDALDAILTGWLSPNAFRFFGIRAQLGRTFDGGIEQLTGELTPPVVLSERYWRRRFAGASDVVGQVLELDGVAHTVIGVVPTTFGWFDVDVFIPLPARAGPYGNYVKLKPGVSLDVASAELTAIMQQRARGNGLPTWQDLRVVLTELNEFETGRLRGAMTALAAAAGVLLLIGCANLSILLTSRGIARQQELAMRKALGASFNRLVRQLVTESLLSAGLAAALGVVLAYAFLPAVMAWLAVQRVQNGLIVTINGKVLLFAVGIAFVAGLAAGLWPSIHLSRDVQPPTRGEIGAARARRLHTLHVFGQVTLTVLLLAVSAAALQAYITLTRASLGYDPTNTTVFGFQLPRDRFTTWEERTAYYERLRAAVATIPGVTVAAVSLEVPPPVVSGRSGVTVDGVPLTTSTNAVMARVSSDYFAGVRMAMQRGRIWTPSEEARAAHVAVVNDAFVRAYLPGANPIGRRVELAGLDRRSPYTVAPPNYDKIVEVIGVVADARNVGLREEPLPAAFVPYTLLPRDGLRLVVRTANEASTLTNDVRRRVADVNRDQAMGTPTAMTTMLQISGWGRERAIALLFMACAGMALLLAGIGLYSVVSCAVAERRRELAVRMALGATAGGVVGAVLRTTATTVAGGLATGLALTVALNRPLMPWTDTPLWTSASLTLVILVFAAIGIIAVVVPARRAVALDPMVVLRGE